MDGNKPSASVTKKPRSRKPSKKRSNRPNPTVPARKLFKKGSPQTELELSENQVPNIDDTAVHSPDIPEDALQGLINRFGPGIGELLNNNQRAKRLQKVQQLLSDIQAVGDEMRQLQGVMELCEYFNMSMEELLGGFPVEQFVPILVDLLNYEHNPDMMLLTTRALCYMIEAIPKSSRTIVKYNAVPIFCNRLMFIQYIDVAEQTLQILGKLSKDHSQIILESGGLTAVLTYLDFFSMSIQRSSVATAANLCRNVELNSFEFIVSVLPLLTNLLVHSDSKVVEYSILAFQRLTKSFVNCPAEIEIIAGEGLVNNCIQLLNGTTPIGTIEEPGPLLNILQIACKHKPEHIITLLKGGIAVILGDLLRINEQSSTPTPNSAGYLLSLLSFTSQLYPKLPPKKAPITVKRDNYIIPQDNEACNSPSKLESLFTNNHTLFDHLSHCIYTSVKDIFSTNTDTTIRTTCLSIIMKILCFTAKEQLDPLLKHLDTSTFVSTLLSSNRLSYVATGLRLATILLEKMPAVFTKHLTREGAVFGVTRLADSSYLTECDSLDDDTKKIKQWISNEAKILKLKFFSHPQTEKDSEEPFATEELQRLQNELAKLSLTKQIQEQRSILETIANMFVDHGVSVFEFLSSGAVDILFKFLTEKLHPTELELRWEMFAEVMEAGEHGTAPLQKLIYLLQNALTQSENFVILLNDKKGRGSGIKFLAKPFKLRLEPCKDETVLSDFSSNIIGIEPLASITAIEKFLWEKIQPLDDSTNKSEESLVIEDEMDTGEFTEEMDHVLEVDSPAPTSLQDLARTTEPGKRLEFYYNDIPLSPSDNIFRVLQHHFNQNLKHDALSTISPAEHLWSSEHRLTYKRATKSTKSPQESPKLQEPIFLTNTIQYFQDSSDHFDLPVPENLRTTLLFLKFIHTFLTLYRPKSPKVLENRQENSLVGELLANKISLKLSQQLQDTLLLCCGELPPWCTFITHCCPFLLPFDVRKQYFTCTKLGIARALHCLQQLIPLEKSSSDRSFVGRIHRQKVRISRSHILRCVFRVMELYGRSKAVLEIEFFDEAGTGLGPTLEFFTLVSHQLQRSDLGMWCHDSTYFLPIEDNSSARKESTDSHRVSENPLHRQGPFEYVSNKGGLFPAPIREYSENVSFLRKMFHLFGVVAAKALLDERMLDIHLSIPFYKWVVGKPLWLDDLEIVYPEIARSMKEFLAVDAEYQFALANACGKTEEEIRESIRFRGCSIEDLSLTFVLPTDPNWELKKNGKDILVTLDNLREYVELVVDALLISGVRIQMNAFRSGFQSVFPISSLECFTVEEIDAMLCGWSPVVKEYWDTEVILEAIVCDHQYTIQSLPVQYFAEALHRLSDEEKRRFLFFLSGSPRLPVGGFKSLKPRLTIVRKDTKGSADDYLPSVMTCVNYVKLPAYSSLEVTTKQLKLAISEGLASFHLS